MTTKEAHCPGRPGAGFRSLPEAWLPRPGRPLCPCPGPRKPGAGEVLLPQEEDQSERLVLRKDTLRTLVAAACPSSSGASPTLVARDAAGVSYWAVQTYLTCQPQASALWMSLATTGEPIRRFHTAASARHSPPHSRKCSLRLQLPAMNSTHLLDK